MVLFALSWRLGPILAGVIIATAFTANMYKEQTKAVETENAAAMNEMNSIANQAFESITTVRSASYYNELFTGMYGSQSACSHQLLSCCEASLELEHITCLSCSCTKHQAIVKIYLTSNTLQ